MSKGYQIRRTSQFKKDLKRLLKQGKDLKKMQVVVDALAAGRKLDPVYLDHPLGGTWKGFRDCHIESDRVLLYKQDRQVLVLTLSRSGSHAELEL